jgi:6-phosphogluconate dehydrogenase
MAEIGIVGLGVMGANLALNIGEKGFRVAVYDRTPGRAEAMVGAAGALGERLTPCASFADLAAALAPPRAVILLVPAGSPVDAVSEAVAAGLGRGDTIIDCGNSHFRDTERRQERYAARAIEFLGVGISGGEEGARRGPSVMAGGNAQAWKRVAPILETAAAHFNGEPCAALLGPGGAGHFVKIVHNGIEYADMEMIAEVYGVMRDGMGLGPPAMAEIFARWNGGRLKSYLIEITATVLSVADPETGKPLVEVIKDTAGQKGTGKWATIEAAELGSPASAIEAAVAARVITADQSGRAAAADAFGVPRQAAARPANAESGLVDDLERALIAGKIIAYAQGFGIMARASEARTWDLPLGTVARIWRAGCIIRSVFLDDIARAYAGGMATAANLMLAEPFLGMLKECEASLRRVVAIAAEWGTAVPSLAAALAHLDMSRARRSTADLIQAQRDFFGAHGFERTDRGGGPYHGPWHKKA